MRAAVLSAQADGQPEPLPDKLVKAWQKARGDVGWMKPDGYGVPEFADTPGPGAIPAVRFNWWLPDEMANLPSPKVPFGLVLSSREMNDVRLKHFAKFTTLVALKLESRTKVTGRGLKHFAQAEGLVFLDLYAQPLTDAGLKSLAAFPNLQHLQLSVTPVTDDGLEHLASLRNLTRLRMSQTTITGSGFKHLTGFDRLTELWLYMSHRVSGTACKYFKGFPNLERLDLMGTRVTDAGLKPIGTLQRLTNLNLNGTKVTDGGLEHLARLSALASLDLASTGVTGIGLEHLGQLRP